MCEDCKHCKDLEKFYCYCRYVSSRVRLSDRVNCKRFEEKIDKGEKMENNEFNYIATDMFDLFLKSINQPKTQEVKKQYKTFKQILKFIIDEFYGVEDILFDTYKDELIGNSIIKQDEIESIFELEELEYQKNVINPQINSLNRR